MINKKFNNDELYNRVLFESKHFKIIPSLGALVEGWLLIIPKEHYISFGKITNEELLEDLQILLDEICEIVKAEFGEYIIFEHGAIEEKSKVGCGVDYAHLHIVPINLTLLDINVLSTETILWTESNGIRATSNYIRNGQPYLFFQDAYQNCYIGTSSQIPSQFFRRIIAKIIEKPEMYDWKTFPFLKNIKSTYNRLAKYTKDKKIRKLANYA